MANLPTAYAGQRFGRKTLDFYAVEGDVVGADPRARSEERRLEDMDGQRHTVRLMDKGFELEPGQTATVLRMQPGPARRSRPVAVVNHDTGGWCRTHPGAEGLLAKAGVSRTLNWILTMGLFALAALALVWPFLRSFLVEVDPSVFGSTPSFSVAELAATALPALAGWSFSDAIAPMTSPLVAAVPALAGLADMLVFGVGVLIASLGVYVLRSWRLLWAPLFVGALGVVALGYGSVSGMVGPALSGLGLAALLFVLGGLINRIRDGARLEARIAVLSDHLLRQGPQDAVVPAEDTGVSDYDEAANDEIDAVVPAGVATAASLREPGQEDGEEVTEGPADAVAEEIEATETEPDEAAESADASEVAEPEAVEATEAAVSEEAVDAEAVEVVEATQPVEVIEPAGADATEGGEDDESEAESADPGVDPATEATAAQGDAVIEPVEGDAAVDTAPEAATEVEAVTDAQEAADSAEAVPSEDAPEPVIGTPDTEDPSVVEAEAEVEGEDTADPVVPAPDEVPEASMPEDTAPAGLDPEEAERLRTDPRYASRAIVLPPPPPMPTPTAAVGEGSGEAVGHGEITTLKPSAPLPDNVIPIFAAPASSEISPEGSPDTETPTAVDEDESPREPS